MAETYTGCSFSLYKHPHLKKLEIDFSELCLKAEFEPYQHNNYKYNITTFVGYREVTYSNTILNTNY